MSVENAFRDMLGSPFGSPPSVAVSPLVLPQGYTGAQTAITYQIISGPRDYTQDGADGVTTFRFQVDIWGHVMIDIVATRDTLVTALSGAYNQRWGSPPVKIHGVFVDNERDDIDAASDIPGPRLFRKTIDFMVTADQR